MLFCAAAVNDALRGQAEYRMVWDTGKQRPVSRVQPLDLWACICLQFSFAIDGGKPYHRCPVCGRRFELGPGVNRAHKTFCSGSCRTRATRQKQQEARRLAAEGKTVRQFAKAVGSKVDKVEGWI